MACVNPTACGSFGNCSSEGREEIHHAARRDDPQFSNSFTISVISQSLEATPAAIAGVTFKV
jgi:hypothetical protein